MWLYRALVCAGLVLVRLLGKVLPGPARFVAEREQSLAEWRQNSRIRGAWWFHVSSVGELEQARPVLESLRERKIGPLILTYFSPSVPRLVRDWSFVDKAGYAPLDTKNALRAFVGVVRPKALVLNRYDLWPEMLAQAKAANIPVALINASTPPLGIVGRLSLQLRHSLFESVGLWTYVDAAAATAWEGFVLRSAKGLVAGNPRVDRVLARVEAARRAPERDTMKWLRESLAGRKVLVAGSTWPADDELLLHAYAFLKERRPRSALVIVPHEPDADLVAPVQTLCKALDLRLQVLQGETRADADVDVYLLNTRGYLAEAYGLGHCAYVGGGFSKHVHSVIEPLAHALPVALGPKHSRAPEVATLAAMGAAFVVQDPRQGVRDLAEWVHETWDEGERLRKAKDALELFTKIHRGAGERIAGFLLKEWLHE